MADNTVKIAVGIDVNALKDDLSQVESLFRKSTGTVAELWADAGAKITEALAKVLAQATQTGQQSAAQMNGAASSVAGFAEGAGAKLNVYLQVALLVVQAAKAIYEAHKRMREEAFNTAHQMAQLTLSFDSEAHSLEIANLRLDDQISKLRGGVSHNKMKEAILEAKEAADKLISSLEKAIEEENKIIEDKVIGGLWEEIFGGGALTKQFKEVINQMYEWRTAQDQLATAQNKLLDAKTKGEKDAAQKEVDLAQDTANKKLKTYRDTVQGELKAEIDELERVKKLQEHGGAGIGLVDDYTKRVALLQQYFHSLEQVDHIEKALDANAGKRAEVGRLETKKEVDAETTRDIGMEKQLAEERVKTGMAGLEQEKARISVMREDTEAQVDARVKAATDLAQKERDIKDAGLKEQKRLLDDWWASVDQKNKHNAQDYNTQTEMLNQQQLQLQKNFEGESERITLEGEKKKTDIRIKAFERFIQDREKVQDRWYAKEKTELDGEAELVKANASRGLITAQQERDQLKAIYDRELDDLRTKIETQLRLEDRLRKALEANGMGPASPEYQASLQRSRQLQDELDRSTAQFGNIISQLDVKLKGLNLTGQQFSQKLRTDMLNTINQLKVAWQGMIQQMNSGFISSFNKMLETATGTLTASNIPTSILQQIFDSGTGLTQRTSFNCMAGIKCADNAGTARTDVRLGTLATVTFSATPIFDASTASTFKLTLTGNVTSSTLTNAVAGEPLAFEICQDATGGRTFVPPANVQGWLPIASAANACSLEVFYHDGTNAQPDLLAGLAGDVTSSPGSTATTVAKIQGTTVSTPTGSGAVVLATSPTLVTPNIGVATATSVNKMAITAPATSATLTIANGKTLTANNTLTLAGTDGTTLTGPGTIPAGGVLAFGVPKFQQFTANGTFTIPAGVTAAKVTVAGAGGAGGGCSVGANNGGGGGAGGMGIKWLSGLTPGNTLTVAVGTGGAGNSNATGNAGGASSVSSGTQTITTVSANGGGGGFSGAATSAGAVESAAGTGGDMNFGGSGGSYATTAGPYGGGGGASVFGGAGGNSGSTGRPAVGAGILYMKSF